MAASSPPSSLNSSTLSPYPLSLLSHPLSSPFSLISLPPSLPSPPLPPSSSLLPYLHMLMDPLVSALSGSQTLISQGLRTLELCVDNLQPDFLYDHIQPVRAELMQVMTCVLGEYEQLD